ncbi:QacE family quaternary ammonium compound efflux SMR transporter [Lentibacillus lipolyticus]|nr:QacE family quaternary ammonium compound efflux SMR transporter [Lentibacillus lipolyticus]
MGKPWVYVVLLCVLELVWVYCLTIASSWWHWAITFVVMWVDMECLRKACEGLPTGTVYAIFASAGTAGIALMDVFLFNATLSFSKVFFILLLVAGVVSLQLADKKAEKQQKEGAH